MYTYNSTFDSLCQPLNALFDGIDPTLDNRLLNHWSPLLILLVLCWLCV